MIMNRLCFQYQRLDISTNHDYSFDPTYTYLKKIIYYKTISIIKRENNIIYTANTSMIILVR